MPAPTDTDTAPARLAQEHDARTLAAALVARLRADGREELAGAIVPLFSGEGALIGSTPPHPHREGEPA
jgi:hypothetical protein